MGGGDATTMRSPNLMLCAVALAAVTSGCATYEQNPWVVEDLDEHKVKLTRGTVPVHAWEHGGLKARYNREMTREAKRACAIHDRRAGAALSTSRECLGVVHHGWGITSCTRGKVTVLVPCVK